ncbi:serine protein kinase RIO [Candidatus Woesearchaeota archaeon]|nr:serine protein kinase RIO [Candidatus Woesearchaeota archaeon]
MSKISHEKWKVWGNVFDEHALADIYKLITQGYFERLCSPISVGKEANIFTAEKKDGSFVIVKIYRLESCNFNKMYDYIKYDPRYENLKKQRRKVIFAWTQREYRNLLKARQAEVRVPTPLTAINNIIVMEYMGDDKKIAEKLKDNAPKDIEMFFEKTIEYIRLLYKKAGIVHGDLSSYNILNYNDEPVFIDFSQGTIKRNQMAEELLERDIKNVCNYFVKKGMKIDVEKVLKQIRK